MRVHFLSAYFISLYTRMTHMSAVEGTPFLSAYFISVYTWTTHMSAAQRVHFLSVYFISVYTGTALTHRCATCLIDTPVPLA